MRILATALGALLISTSQPALALGGVDHGEPQLGDLQQMQVQQVAQPEPQPAEAQQCEPEQPAEMQQAEVKPAETPPPVMQQVEVQPAETPPPVMPEAEVKPAETPAPPVKEAEAQPAETPPPAVKEAEAQPAETPPPAVQQAAVQQGETQPSGIMPAAVGQGEPGEATAAVPAGELPLDAKWTVFIELKYGTRLDVPSAVFAAADGPAYRGLGRQFKTPDGRALLAVYSQRNDARDTPESYLRKNFKFPRAALAYQRVTPEFFAVAGIKDGTVYYSRCNFSHNAGGAVHCFDLKYPEQEKRNWDGIVTRMSRSLRPLNRG